MPAQGTVRNASGTESYMDEGDEEEPEMRAGVIGDSDHGERLDKVVVALVPELSRSHLQQLIKGGWARLDDTAATSPAQRVRTGQRLAVTLQPTAESRAYRGEALPLRIVHRLDKDTSGLMVVGRTLAAVTALVRAIAGRDVSRRYLAITHGVPRQERMTIEAPVGRDPKLRTRMAIVASGKTARTDVELVASAGGFSLVRCTLHSGRTHQIRVHLASRGLPLVGDRLYGGAAALGMERQALHAARLAFAHPVSGAQLELSASPPADFAAARAQITTLSGF